MDAYVFNLPHRTERWELMVKNWSNHLNLIKVENMVMVEDDGRPKVKRASEGLGYTHMNLLKEAKAKGMKTILLLEDDAIPEPNWFERWVEIKEYLDTHLDEWDVFNGAVHFLRYFHGTKELEKSCLINGSVGCASHFIYLNLDAFDKFMKWEIEKADIDTFYCNRNKLYCSYPILSKQADGESDIVDEPRWWMLTYLRIEAEFKYFLGDLYLKYQQIKSKF
jgi:hypothetical protein